MKIYLRAVLTTTLTLLAALPLPGFSHSAGDYTTTDDNRRVPIPPTDYASQPVTVLRGGTLIDGSGNKPLENAIVVVRGDRIEYAGSQANYKAPAAATTIDTSGQFMLPGLIDLHLHFTQQRGEDFGLYRDSDSAATIRGVKLLGQLADAGITTVRDVGTRNDVALQLKVAVERKMLDGPRVLWSGQIIASRGGHGDEITSTGNGRPRSLGPSSRVRVANGPWDWRLAVREQIRMHADWIKLTAPYTKEEVNAAVDEAHLHGIPVAVDAFGEFVEWAALAGMDTIEHPLNLNRDIIKVMARQKTDFVPTLTAFYNVVKEGYPTAGIPTGGFYYTMSRRFQVSHEQHIEMVGLAHKSGIRIGVGTDIPFENEIRYPGDYYTELGFLKDAGMSNSEVLASATRVGAEILKLQDKLGTVEAGKLADILVVAANPLEDIANLQAVRLVMADGRVIRDFNNKAGRR